MNRVGFFDSARIQALQCLAAHALKEQQAANITATAAWVGKYRSSLTPADRVALGARLNSAAGKHTLQKATAPYNSQDIYYRGKAAPVISQLLKTNHEVQGNNQ